ncbi:MAG: hypothetical protein K6F69_01760 [Treponema sp.]|nr:hypothetical protein [Treponema sp.]
MFLESEKKLSEDLSNNNGATDSWYSKAGPESDVVLSSRVRLARNLANFPFPNNLKNDDGLRICSIVFDAFSNLQNPEQYHSVQVKNLESLGERIMAERGIIDMGRNDNEGLVLRSDGKISCLINSIDHVRIASFVPGLNFDEGMSLCKKVDDELQQRIQFAASYDFGYLTSSLFDTGSGMKVSVRVHLPSLSYLDRTDDLFSDLLEKDFSAVPCYGAGKNYSAALGSYYQISSVNSFYGSELDQITAITAVSKYLCEMERRARNEMIERHPTALRDIVYRAYALARFSRFLTLKDAIEIISGIKWGADINIVGNIENNVLFALLYRIQDAHLEYVLQNGTFNFEKDVEVDTKAKICRLRALILQEAFEKLEIKE